MREIKVRTSQRPRPLPPGRWAMTQRWNDLLFAHWRAPASQVVAQLPEGLHLDTFDGTAWLGVVPFWMDRIKVRGVPSIPGARSFPELNMRTYVRDHRTGTPGVYFFSLDGANLLAVMVARSSTRSRRAVANRVGSRRATASTPSRCIRRMAAPSTS